MSTDLPTQLADLPPAVAAAISRAAKRISDASESYGGFIEVEEHEAVEIITEELRPALLGGPLPPASQDLRTAPPGMITVPIAMLPVRPANQPINVPAATADLAQWITLQGQTGESVKIDTWRGCISSKPCHRCRVVWHSGVCVCGLTHCYQCGHWLRGEGDTTDYERINSDHYAGPKAAQIDPLVTRFTLADDGRVVSSL